MATSRNVKKYICIHGHFYQPPRENPWLGEIEREDSAAPEHDWNMRIDKECYRANTAARLVDHKNRILTIRNNYEWISFNFGPTVLDWIEKNDSWTYEKILEADRESCSRLNGHGNAVAQVYNHTIMPLANRRDKVTQVKWGIRDFVHRFKRRPEGMWLAETAVDRETLSVLAENGILYTILSPAQAARWKPLRGEARWEDARNGSIPTGTPYFYDCGQGKHIALFFYDASLARGIAFERLLEHSSRLVSKINNARPARVSEPWLIHTATDGESYGHHFKFGDMALGAALADLVADPAAVITNYGAFLSQFPPVSEVEIVENSAWSCSHGLGRWQADCGCSISNNPKWTQEWRASVRKAMNELRDKLIIHYEREMGKFVRDPWQVRDDYVDVLLGKYDRTEFMKGVLRPGSPDHPARFYQLLEMQKYAMFMFTSCGWFFDDVSGLESVLVMRYAARAMQLARETGSEQLEAQYLETLRGARSNDPEYKDGARVYMKKVAPEVVEKDRVVASYAIQSLSRTGSPDPRLYRYEIRPMHEEELGPGPAPFLFGHVLTRDTSTTEEAEYLFAVVHFGGLEFRCSVKPYPGEASYSSSLHALQQAIEQQNTVKMIRTLDDIFGTAYFSLHDVFTDMRSSIALEISRQTLDTYTDLQRHLYNAYRPLMSSLRQWKIRVPGDLRAAVRRVLSDEAEQLIESMLEHERNNPHKEITWDNTDFFCRAHLGRLHAIIEDARSWGALLQVPRANRSLGELMLARLEKLGADFSNENAGAYYRLMKICIDVGSKPQLWEQQSLYFELIRRIQSNPNRVSSIRKFSSYLEELDEFLECRFTGLLFPRSTRLEISAGN